jgi:GH24 family phage-related lysozyme (muramidase)
MSWYKKASLASQIKDWLLKGFSATAIMSALMSNPTYANEIKSIDVPKLIQQIKEHEGIEYKSYPDKGGRSVGVGFYLDNPDSKRQIEDLGLNFDDVYSGKAELNDDQIDILLGDGLAQAIEDAKKFLGVENFINQPTEVKHILVNMAYNLGGPNLKKFKNFRNAVIKGEYWWAAMEMKYKNPSKSDELSDWCKDTGERCLELVERMFAVR